MTNSLVVERGREQGRKYLLSEADVLIGRDASNYICIPEIKVSRRHCRISFVDGQYILDDLKSANGTFINGVRVSRCQLNRGDRLQIGETEIIVEQLITESTPSDENIRSNERSAGDQNAAGPANGAHKKTSAPVDLPGRSRTAAIVAGRSRKPEIATVIDPISGAPASRLDEESSYYDRVTDDREASRRFVQVGNDLRFIYHASLATARNTDRERMLTEILDLIFQWIAADRGCVFLKSELSEAFEMKFFKCRVELEGFDFKVSRSIISYVRQKKVGVLSARAAKDQRWGAQPSILRMKTGEVLCVPIQGRDELLGLIYLDTLIGAGTDEIQRFNEDNLKLLIAMAHQAAVAIENEAYYAALLEKERLAAIGETTRVIAHHVKNMLQGVNGGAHLVETGLRTGDTDVISKGWQIVSRNQDQISRLVIDMLMLARPYQANLATADLNLAIRNAIEELQLQLSAQNMVCLFEPNQEILPFKFDGIAITSAVLHLINLSLLACRTTDCRQIMVRVGYRAGNIVVIITDHGEPVEVSETDDVLDPFGFEDDKKVYGIGLAVSRKIVAGHEGRLLLSHPNNKGNRFVIELPLEF